MKKTFFSLVMVFLACTFARANNVNIINLTTCTFTVSLNGGCGGIVSIPPTGGVPMFFPCSGTGSAAKVAYYSGGVLLSQVNLVYPNMLTGTSTIVPPCMTNFYNCSWVQASPTADATLIIY